MALSISTIHWGTRWAIKLLQSVAKRVVKCVRGSDTVSRQGGDEFVVLLSEVQRAEDAAVMARRILRSVARSHVIDERDLHITTSIGVSVYPDDGLDADTLDQECRYRDVSGEGKRPAELSIFQPLP